MALNLDGNQYELVEFDDTNEPHFILSSTDHSNVLKFDYKPQVDKSFNRDEYEIVLLVNSFLNAENDVFSVYDCTADSKESRVGWIFPITILESNDSEHSKNSHLHGYLHIAFEKLLLTQINGFQSNATVRTYQPLLSDVYGDDTILLVIKKTSLIEPENFNYSCYLPSLSKYGYFLKNEHNLEHELDKKKPICMSQRGKIRLNITKSKYDLTDNSYFYELYCKHLKTVSNELLRFHLLYQVIEHFIGEEFERKFEEKLENFKSGEIQTNDFIEEINTIKKERVNIREIISFYQQSSSNAKDVLADLIRYCTDFLEPYTSVKAHSGDLLYDTRNLLVHSFRSLNEAAIEQLVGINTNFELVVSELFILKDSR